MLTVQASTYIIRGSAMDALYVTREYFGCTLYDLDGLISDFIDSLERAEIQEWAELIVNGEFLSFDYNTLGEDQISFSI